MNISSGGGTPSWGTALGQNEGHKITFPGYQEFIPSMVYKMVPNMNLVKCPLGKGGNKPQYAISSDYEYVIASIFTKVFVNGKMVQGGCFILLVTKELNNAHSGRLTLKYSPKIEYDGISNADCYQKMRDTLNISEDAAWFISDINIKDQEELHFTAFIGNSKDSLSFESSDERKKFMISLLPDDYNGLVSSMKSSDCPLPLQRILYGAPGTGKSFSVFEAIAIHSGIIKEGEKLSKEQRKALEESKNVFRTTFHPDYDYAQFVGCYKPTKSSNRILSQAELVKVFNDMTETYPLSKIGYQYWESFEKIDASEFLKACGKESQAQELGNGIELGKKFRKDTDKITYEFTPQVFTQALIKAYENLDESVYLVIEEINRGNCAQIFGDIFQLLDRNSETGVSEYSINVDEDLRKYLEGLKIDGLISKDGKIKLPRNFNIIATMNTSDQSLFPMDSAFKRRWDWKYVAVNYSDEIDSSKFEITIDGKKYKWHTFLQAVNKKIKDVTKSEDKQMGNFFIKQSVNEEEFCNKVMFYLWNDVSKDYYESNDSLFQCKTNNGTTHFSFNELFEGDARRTELLKGFMGYIGYPSKGAEKEINNDSTGAPAEPQVNADNN